MVIVFNFYVLRRQHFIWNAWTLFLAGVQHGHKDMPIKKLHSQNYEGSRALNRGHIFKPAQSQGLGKMTHILSLSTHYSSLLTSKALVNKSHRGPPKWSARFTSLTKEAMAHRATQALCRPCRIQQFHRPATVSYWQILRNHKKGGGKEKKSLKNATVLVVLFVNTSKSAYIAEVHFFKGTGGRHLMQWLSHCSECPQPYQSAWF